MLVCLQDLRLDSSAKVTVRFGRNAGVELYNLCFSIHRRLRHLMVVTPICYLQWGRGHVPSGLKIPRPGLRHNAKPAIV